MNWTAIGKTLVFFNLVLSIIFAAWAAGIYTNRIDWPGGGAGISGEKAEGEYTRRQKEIQALEKAAGVALARWQANTKYVKDLERHRPIANAFYASKLASLNQNANPITALVYQNDRLVLDPNGPKIAGADGKELLARQSYYISFSAAEKKIQEEIEETKKLIAEAEDLTLEINGEKGKTKGLRDLLDELETAHRQTVGELEYLLPFRYNRQAEQRLLEKRQVSLNSRVNELNRAARK
jgi:hypothetical protein